MDWATNGMQLWVEITWLQPVNSLGKAFTGTAGEENSLGSFCQKKGMFCGLALDNTHKLPSQCLAIQPCC